MAYINGIFGRWLLNTLLYAGVGSIIGTLLAAIAGYALVVSELRTQKGIVNLGM